MSHWKTEYLSKIKGLRSIRQINFFHRREYWEKGYRTWAEENHYGMRWPGTEGIFSAVKRKFGENCVSRYVEGLEAEGYQRLWIYDYINQEAKNRVKAMN
jgi:hypothetical protein